MVLAHLAAGSGMETSSIFQPWGMKTPTVGRGMTGDATCQPAPMRARAAGPLLAALLLVGGCADDDDGDDTALEPTATPTTATPTTAAAGTSSTTTTPPVSD